MLMRSRDVISVAQRIIGGEIVRVQGLFLSQDSQVEVLSDHYHSDTFLNLQGMQHLRDKAK